jgi:diguanylate cyclase (GGDEF)-like protein
MAYTDELTRLGNRKAYFERTEELFRGSAERGRPILHGVLFIDMDNFRAVHEYRSHAVGDSVLVEVARRIERTVKGSEFVFRISGDEFAVVLRDLNNEAEARDVARRILDEIARPYELQMGCDVIRLSASIGLSLYPSDSESAEELIRQADTALDGAKREGNSVCRFSSDIQERLRARLDMIADLRLALGREEFTLVYQPIISADGKLTGAEALLRWQSPERGTVQPMEFIPLLEETGLIVQVGRWVIETACGQAREFQNEGLEDFGLSVNLSPRQLEDFGIADRICETLKATGLRPEQLSLEITESLITEHETVLPRLEKLHETGIQVSIDDFGTGYSSLSRLSQLPIDVLKVDKSFVDQMDVDRPHSSIVGPIVNLARILGLQVIVEGVETESQLLAIRGLGCDHMQGYLFSHPLPPAAFIDYARSLTTVSGEPVAFLQTPVRTLSDEVATR